MKRTLSEKPEDDTPKKQLSPFVKNIREDLQRILGTEVKIKGNDEKGKIEIDYYSQDDLSRILESIKGGPLE